MSPWAGRVSGWEVTFYFFIFKGIWLGRAVEMRKHAAETEAETRASVSTVETPGPVSLI